MTRKTRYPCPEYNPEFTKDENSDYDLGWQSFLNNEPEPKDAATFMFLAGYYEAWEAEL